MQNVSPCRRFLQRYGYDTRLSFTRIPEAHQGARPKLLKHLTGSLRRGGWKLQSQFERAFC